ncbi:MAG: hypothetical protein NVS3B14_20130 [Ktedonobacteraceae bacterium]
MTGLQSDLKGSVHERKTYQVAGPDDDEEDDKRRSSSSAGHNDA